MKYQILTTDKFDKSFKNLDRQTQKIIKSWINKNLVNCDDPRLRGKGLTVNRSCRWRYRIGDYRVLAEIRDNELVLIFIDVGLRKNIY